MPVSVPPPCRTADAATPFARPQVDLIIFDCDGVLIDSEIVVCRLTSEELSRFGFPLTTEQVIERFAGRPEREMIAEITGEWGHPLPATYFTNMRRRTEAAYRDELVAMPGVADALARMRVERCVASSSHPTKLALGPRAVGLHEQFVPHIISANSVARGKPAPDVFIYAAGWMRHDTSACLVIEDSLPGVQAAVAAGMRVFGFTGGTHCLHGHADRLLAAGAEQVFRKFSELEAMLPCAFAAACATE